jgi:stage II sporulation protein D
VRGRLQLINVLPLEEYLAAVLGGEMPASFPEEALKAQAVAARTYAMEKKLGSLGEPYYLGSSVLSQVYAGISREDARTKAAVKETRGQILTFHLQPIEAYFHASCGGRTESGRDALGRDLPYLKPVDCPCGKLPQSHWSLKLSDDALEEALGHDADSLRVLSRTPTGRAQRLEVGGHRMDATAFRAKVGYSRVKSLSFTVEEEGKGFLLRGKGYGHGAGLCQWGAKVYADRGWSYRKILAHYYPGTDLQTLY